MTFHGDTAGPRMAETGEAPATVHRSAILRSAGVILGALLVFLLLGEAATRVLSRDGRIYDIEMFKYSRALKRDAPPEAAAMHHWHVPGRSARLQGVDVRINSKGLRDVEREYALPPGVSRILVLGDSITLGWGVRMEDAYPRVLERVLEGDRRGVYEVINGGVGNYTTSRIIGLYRHELHKYGANTVVFAFFLNNANDLPDSRLKFLFDTPLQFPVFLWSRVQRVATRYRISKGFDEYYDDLYSDQNPLFQRFRSELEDFLDQLSREGRLVIVASVPDVFHLREPSYRYQKVTDKVFAIARARGAHTTDLFPALQGMAPAEIMNTPEDRHPNAEGHRRMARALYEALESLGI